MAATVVWFANTAGLTGATVIGLALVAWLSLRAPIDGRRALREAGIHIAVLAVVLGGGALANGQLLKTWFATPRPNLVQLAEDEMLGMPVEEFHNALETAERRDHYRAVLADSSAETIELAPRVRDHGVHDVGYAFPSGRTFTAMLSATCFLAMGRP